MNIFKVLNFQQEHHYISLNSCKKYVVTEWEKKNQNTNIASVFRGTITCSESIYNEKREKKRKGWLESDSNKQSSSRSISFR